MSGTNKFRYNNYCVCGNQECFRVQTQLCELVTPATSKGDDDTNDQPQPPTTDVWCHPSPLSILFNPTETNYQSWLFILSVCHHIPRFKDLFIAYVTDIFKDASSLGSKTKTKQWYINRIHFPRGLLENRATYNILQNVSLMSPSVAKRLANHDGDKPRTLEYVNTVAFLDKLADRILGPTNSLSQFQQSKKAGLDGYYVQAPVEVINEARFVLATMLSNATRRSTKLSINREAAPTPKRKQDHRLVTPSTKKAKTPATSKQQNPLCFVDAIVASTTTTTSLLSPTRGWPAAASATTAAAGLPSVAVLVCELGSLEHKCFGISI